MIRIGTQAWKYAPWIGPFYPEGTRDTDILSTYARAFKTVEADTTFYAVPSAKTVHGWCAQIPDDFVFALKVPEEITHRRRLRNSGDLVVQFLDAAREFGPKLGPILVQLGPDFGPAELPALAAFIPLLPPDMNFAVEFRQRGWISDEVVALLKDHRVALALTDSRWMSREEAFELAENPTSDFAYVRWIGPDRSMTDFSHIQVDRSKEIDAWARTLKGLATRVKNIYGYASNHFAGHSPGTARMILEALGMPTIPPERMGDQLRLL